MRRTLTQRQQRGRERIFYAGGDGIRMIPILRGGAGSYADAPSRRMAYDDDGTVVTGLDSAVETIFEVGASTVTAWNSEDAAGAQTSESDMGHFAIFPELREVDGTVHSQQKAATTDVQTSGDSTNGVDGTFTVRATDITQNVNIFRPNYRTTITSLAVSNVRVLWLDASFGGASTSNQRLEHWHIYGEISAGETPDRLLWFDDSDDLEFSLPIDYGDVPRGSAS